MSTQEIDVLLAISALAEASLSDLVRETSLEKQALIRALGSLVERQFVQGPSSRADDYVYSLTARGCSWLTEIGIVCGPDQPSGTGH